MPEMPTVGPKYGLVAALLTRPSTLPNSSMVLVNSSSIASGRPTWVATGMAVPPSAVMLAVMGPPDSPIPRLPAWSPRPPGLR